MTKDQARTTLLGVRIGLCAAVWLAPRAAGRLFGIRLADNPAGTYLARLFGTRDGWLAAEVLLAEGAARDALLRRHVAIDAADVVAATASGLRGTLPKPAALLAGGTAATAVALGLVAVGD